jgi:TRAP-type uncharacterized transport system substrate-binding protein
MDRPRVAFAQNIPKSSFALSALLAIAALATPAQAQETIDVGETGFHVKRPVLASACQQGCPWGELGDFVTEAMQPLGYEVIQCRNCNRAEGPRIVAKASYPPELDAVDSFVGTTTRVDAPIDFGITESGFLAWAHAGRYVYAEDGPYANLRLIAKIEDPTYLLVAVKADSTITNLAQIAEQRLPVTILGGDTPTSKPVLDHYGLTREAVESWGGSMQSAIVAGALGVTEFDLIVNELASPANNRESSFWTTLSQKFALRFLDLPEELLEQMANTKDLGMTRAVAKWGLLRGVDRPIPTVARSGEAIFARADTPEEAAYDVAKAIDAHRSALKWFIRPYSYDSRSVWQNFDVPLHPGARRYYCEVGYLAESPDHECPPANKGASGSSPTQSGGCSFQSADAGSARSGRRTSFALLGLLLVWGRARHRRHRAALA